MTSKTSPRRFEAVSSGPKRRKFSRVARDHVAQEAAEHARRLAEGRRRARHLDRVVAEVGQDEVAEQHAAVRVRVRAHAAVAASAPARRARAGAGPPRRRAPRAGSCAASPRAARSCSGFSRTPASGTWCERHVPSTGTPSTSRGPVQPFGVRRTIIGQRGRVGRRSLRAACAGSPRSRRATSSSAAAKRSCTAAGSSPSKPPETRIGSQP